MHSQEMRADRSFTPLIEYRNITVMRGRKAALVGITLSIGCGEHVSILGPNGSGKSSLIKTITRECYPALTGESSGLRILGQDRWNIFELRALLGIVSNDLLQSCSRNYSAREVILSGFFSSIGVWPNHHVTPPMKVRADEVLELLEIGHLADRYVSDLSSGEARRVVIGRALVHKPKALVLDEPSASLDLRASHELRDILRKLAQSGTSIILVTHHLPDIIPEIRRVVLLRQGRIFLDGPKETVLTAESLSRLFETPVELVCRDGYYHLW